MTNIQMIFTWKNLHERLRNFHKIYLEHICISYDFQNYFLPKINCELKNKHFAKTVKFSWKGMYSYYEVVSSKPKYESYR